MRVILNLEVVRKHLAAAMESERDQLLVKDLQAISDRVQELMEGLVASTG